MGSLVRRGKIYWAYYYDRDNVRQRVSTKTSDPVVARARLRDLELSTTDRAPHETEAVDAALSYFVDVVCASKSQGTRSCYDQKQRHVAAAIGDVLCDNLKREIVERYIATRLKAGAHTHSVAKELVVLRGALKSAKARDRFHGSLDVVPEFDAGYEPRKLYLTPDEFIAVIDNLVQPAPPKATEKTVAKVLKRKQRRALYCMLIAYGSPRRGELEALDWTHVDLARDVMGIPKGKTKGRPIAIHPQLRPWLEAMHEGSGRVVDPWANVTRDLEWAAKRAGLPKAKQKLTPNDLRRTFASWLVQAGASLYVVSRLLGHSSTRMVELVYGQLDDATLVAAIAKLPGDCAAGVPNDPQRHAHSGASGHGAQPTAIVNSVEESFASREVVVPRDGVEPPTRGFSVLMDLVPKRNEPKRNLKAV